jgi:hypothetical protein
VVAGFSPALIWSKDIITFRWIWQTLQKPQSFTPFGLVEYLFMPFGLTNVAQTFQRLMDRLIGQLPFGFTYLDDHLIASATMEEHLEHLRKFFEILQDNGLTNNPSKCTFAVSSVKFLGHMVSESGVVPLPRHVEAISSFPRPYDLRQLQRFLGLINFYRPFLPAIAGVLKPLTDLLRGAPKMLLCSPAADAAFTKAKAALVAAVPLSHPAPGTVLSLAVDASDTHAGGVLQQLQGRAWQPLAFFSKKLSSTQARYSTFDRELLAAFGGTSLPFPPGRPPFPHPDGPQTFGGGHVQGLTAVVRQAAASDGLPGRIHRRFPSHSRGD